MSDATALLWSLPPVAYHDPTIARAELDLLRRCWLGIGRSDLVAPGEARALDMIGIGLIVSRDEAGQLHALANTCRHRGARVFEGHDACATMQCPFHGWTYRSDGSLLAAPKMSEAAEFDRTNFGLASYRVEERSGFVFVCLDPETPPLDTWLGDFTSLHAPWPLDDLVTVRRRELTVDCNWKAFLDVFNDYYHLPFVHRESLGDMYARPDARDDTTGAFTSQFGTTSGTGALLKDEQELALPPMPGLASPHRDGVRYTWAFPTMTFAAGSDSLWMYQAVPDTADPGRCHVVQTCAMPAATVADPAHAERIDAYLRRLDAALDEDIAVLTTQHRGLVSPDAQPGPLHPHLEPSVAAFAQWYRNEMPALPAN